jgi:hypothetical protein
VRAGSAGVPERGPSTASLGSQRWAVTRVAGHCSLRGSVRFGGRRLGSSGSRPERPSVSITLQKSLYELTFGGDQVGSRDLGAAPGLSGRGRALSRGKLAARPSPAGPEAAGLGPSGYGRSAGANFPTMAALEVAEGDAVRSLTRRGVHFWLLGRASRAARSQDNKNASHVRRRRSYSRRRRARR